MGFIKEFKEFAMRGNLVDLAVGFVVGAAFTAVTKAFIDGLIMPLVGLLFRVGDLNNLVFQLGTTVDGKPNFIKIGVFISAVINFLIVAFAMFLLVKAVNALKRKKEEEKPAEPPPATKDQELLTEIRDLLKSKH